MKFRMAQKSAFFIVGSLDVLSAARSPEDEPILIYVGTYTGDGEADSKGIYAVSFYGKNASMKSLGLVAVTSNPTYLLVHPSQKYLMSVNEQKDGKVNAFAINSTKTGELTLVSSQTTRGGYPIYLSSSKLGESLFVANYMSGTVGALPFDVDHGNIQPAAGVYPQNGSSIDPDSQTSSHPHCILLDKKEEFAVSADLGSDELYVYRFISANGTLEKLHVTKSKQPGDGPRHLIFSDNGNYVYVMNELTTSITVYAYYPMLRAIQTISTVPTTFSGINYGAELLLHPISGRFLYASNRGHDSMVTFAVDRVTGLLTTLQYVNVEGHTPRHFNILPNGKHLIVANQDSNSLVVFSIDQATGKLAYTGSSVHVSKPTCISFAIPSI